ncbi:MAG: putative mRNA 3-end processing factor [Thermoproteota archaeon]|nr:putative mRNA 3-end processing factor [Thermoproteota archaeon]
MLEKFHKKMVVLISSEMSVKFLGGAGEVGRSAIAIKSEKTQILVDYGVMMDHQLGFPMHVPPNDVDGIILTHCHLDHCGAIPLFHIRSQKPVYGTGLSFALSRLLITDFIHLTGYYLPYEYIDLQTMMSCAVEVDYRVPFSIGDLKVELLESGHIPGGSQVIVEVAGKRVLYTSDFNTVGTRLLKAADQAYGKIDAIIMESTYADADHEERGAVENKFMEKVNEAVERGGTVLVPAFSVGRSQEILCILAANGFKYPVTVDGMAKDTNEILTKYPQYLSDSKLFMDAVHMANWVRGWRDRRLATKKPGVIVSPAGMLKGGNALFYMNSIARKSENAVFLVSYQVPDSPGNKLLESKRFLIGGKMKEVKAEVEQFDFTSHCGKTQLIETVRKIGTDVRVFVMHGAEGNCQRLAKDIEAEFGLEVAAPRTGDTFEL